MNEMNFDKITDIITVVAVILTAAVVGITIHILNGGMI